MSSGLYPQDKPRAQKKHNEHLQIVQDTTESVRSVDTIYLEQLELNARLDSLVEASGAKKKQY